GLTGIDTRRLTRKLRDDGSQNGAIGALSTADLVDLARAAPKMEGLDLASEVTAKSVRTYESSLDTTTAHVVAMDLGMKTNILRSLRGVGCRVTVVPSRTTAEEILALGPDGIFVSNGPGDPAAVTYAIDTIRGLLGKRPLFGICLGHQLLALALGGRTYKLKFGHRGLNQPVVDLATRKVSITSQNHGFAVDTASLPRGARPSFSHLNDDTSEGLDVPEARAFSVQFHPEAAAGPHDTLSLFSRFVRDMSAPAT
ncbi:MAG: glutamine-hydrolyzing carbamoyl-phosphate synthase small subunit, partial [Polyangiaceae bacterium]